MNADKPGQRQASLTINPLLLLMHLIVVHRPGRTETSTECLRSDWSDYNPEGDRPFSRDEHTVDEYGKRNELGELASKFRDPDRFASGSTHQPHSSTTGKQTDEHGSNDKSLEQAHPNCSATAIGNL